MPKCLAVVPGCGALSQRALPFGLAAMAEALSTESAQGVPELGRGLLAIVAARLQSAHDRFCSFPRQLPERLAVTLPLLPTGCASR